MEQQLNIKCVTTTTEQDGSIYGKFVIEPLSRGFGLTLGNALRRVLLFGLSGAAFTSVRIQNINHEFSTLPNVVEDVLDIMLNLKGVVLKMDTDEPQVLRLDIDKEGPVTAADIELNPNVRIINPGWHLCTLSEGGSIHMELIAETGAGYVPAEQHIANRSVDSLALDAAFLPIRRVAYNVDSTRVGLRTDFDSLTLEIWSNGSMDVSSALSKAANQLIEHLLPVASLSGVPTVMAQVSTQEADELGDVPNITIEDLELSVRAFNCLKRANIHNIQELLQKSELDLLSIKNFGKKSSDEVIERLEAFNLSLKPNPEGVALPLGDD
jgi:DNA-directed RNA polymerase subunit alpha